MTEKWTEQDSINLTATLVAHDGHRLALRGAERAAALRTMAVLGLDRAVIAERLCMTGRELAKAAAYYGVTLPPAVGPAHWTLALAQPSQSHERRAARRRRDRDREKANA